MTDENPTSRVRQAEHMGHAIAHADRIAEIAARKLTRWAFGDANAEPLVHAPHWQHFSASVQPALDAYAQAMTQRLLNPSSESDNELGASEQKLHSLLKQNWLELWRGHRRPRPDIPSRSELEGAMYFVVHYLLYPSYTIPVVEKLAVFGDAYAKALQDGQAQACMQDAQMADVIEDALRGLADQYFAASQSRNKVQHEPIVMGQKQQLTYADERQRQQRVRMPLRVAAAPVGEPPPADMYDFYAELEARMGTEKAAAVGVGMCGRFIAAMQQSIAKFERDHKLDQAFYYEGRLPAIATR